MSIQVPLERVFSDENIFHIPRTHNNLLYFWTDK